jgi:hypothetical protein
MLSPPNKTAIFNSRSSAKSPRIVLERFAAIRDRALVLAGIYSNETSRMGGSACASCGA